MRIMRKKQNQHGLSLIEIVVAGIILTAAFMTLAFVYPSGYKLTETNKRASQATEIARSIMEEIKLLPMETSVEGVPTTISEMSIVNLNNLTQNPGQMEDLQWPFHHYASTPAEWQTRCPVAVNLGYGANEQVAVNELAAALAVLGKAFFIMPGYISVTQFVDPKDQLNKPGGIVASNESSWLANIEVRVAWIEPRGASYLVRDIRLNYVKTGNKY